MLKEKYDFKPTQLDLLVYEKVVPADHYLRKLKAAINFTPWRAQVADSYASGMGRGAYDPVCLLKLLLLQFHYGLSDDRVIREAQVNLAFRFFLDLSLDATLPEPSLLSQFRTRLGAERIERIFQEIVGQARAAGLVKDRLRLKDATHVLANIAVPSTIQLVAQIRTQLLQAIESFAPEETAARRQEAAMIRESTADLKDEARLLRRVEHLRELVAWGEAWLTRVKEATPSICTPAQQEALATALQLAHKILKDREPKAGDQLRALSDPEARRNKHGAYYDGYLLDVMMDADSEIICGVDTLPANGDEAANAKNLIEREEAAHGNDIEMLSIDRIGYNGAVLEAISDDPTGPQVTVYVPPKESTSNHPGLFPPDDFTLNEAGDEVTCPAGQTTRLRHRDDKDHAWQYRFSIKQCRDCPLRAQCQSPNSRQGRAVNKSDFQTQYRAAQQRATTPEYKQIRKEHPRIERKLNELVRWHDGRHVRYRGRLRVKVQYLLLAVVVNCKRIVRLLTAASITQPV